MLYWTCSQPCANTGTNSNANGLADCCETPNAVPVSYNVIHIALYQRPYWHSITHYAFIWFPNYINIKKQHMCKIHNFLCMSSGTQPILPEHVQQVPRNAPVLVFSKLISTMTIKDIVKSETDNISWVVAAFCKCWTLPKSQNSKNHSPSWEVNCWSTGQEIPQLS
jgi:hypothetical protein